MGEVEWEIWWGGGVEEGREFNLYFILLSFNCAFNITYNPKTYNMLLVIIDICIICGVKKMFGLRRRVIRLFTSGKLIYLICMVRPTGSPYK